METARRRRRSRGRGLIPLVALALAVAACGGSMPPLERATGIVEDDGRFGTALEAGESFADVAELLLQVGRDCAGSCPALLQAAAYVELVALDVLECSLPEVHDVRRAVLGHVTDAIAAPSVAGEPPPLPGCSPARD